MSDTLTPHARALIDAFPADRITRVPRGVSGEPVAYRFRGDLGGHVAFLRGTMTARDKVKQVHRIIARQRRFAAALRREERG